MLRCYMHYARRVTSDLVDYRTRENDVYDLHREMPFFFKSLAFFIGLSPIYFTYFIKMR